MIRNALAAILAITLFASSGVAFAADHLDCMTVPLGAAEQSVLDRHYVAKRGDDRRNVALSAFLNGRAQSCGYLYGWSERAMRLAAHHRWLQIQWKLLEPIREYSADEEMRRDAALATRLGRLVTLFKPDVDAVATNAEMAPPKEDMFRDFLPMIKEAKISGKNSSEQNLSLWLYRRGSVIALEKAFADS